MSLSDSIFTKGQSSHTNVITLRGKVWVRARFRLPLYIICELTLYLVIEPQISPALHVALPTFFLKYGEISNHYVQVCPLLKVSMLYLLSIQSHYIIIPKMFGFQFILTMNNALLLRECCDNYYTKFVMADIVIGFCSALVKRILKLDSQSEDHFDEDFA